MKRVLSLSIVIMLAFSLSGCTEKKKVSNNDDIAEAQVVKDDTNQNINNSANKHDEHPQATIEPGGKVVVTEDIKNKVLAFASGLSDYKAGDKLNDQMKFKFVYYGYSSNELARYTKKNIDIEGKTNTWALVPKEDVEKRFKEIFGLDLGEYKPTLNEDDPTVYLANNYYYICVSSEKDNVNYSLLKEGDSIVKVKEVYEGDDRYNEINITLQTANNTNGFIVTGVQSVPK
jgi:hypothetical protein